MTTRFGDARMPSLRDKINSLALDEKTVKVKKIKVGKVSKRSKVKVKKL